MPLKIKTPQEEGLYEWSHLSQKQGYIYTDYQLVKFIRWFDNRTNLVRSSNHLKNQVFLTRTLVQVPKGPKVFETPIQKGTTKH